MKKYKTKLIIGLTVISAFVISGCNMQSVKENATELGAVTGAAVGAILADNKYVGAVIGAVLGGVIGKSWGDWLDEKDQESVVNSTEDTITTGDTNEWYNPDNGNSGTTEVVSTQKQKQMIDMPVLKDRISKVPPLDIIGETYKINLKDDGTTGNVNLRGGPGTDYVVVDSLPRGMNINVVGKVTDKNWYMVSENGVGSGFIHSSLLRPAPEEVVTESEQFDKSEIVQKSVDTEKTCRTVQQTVTRKDGSERQEEIKACQGPNGWEVV